MALDYTSRDRRLASRSAWHARQVRRGWPFCIDHRVLAASNRCPLTQDSRRALTAVGPVSDRSAFPRWVEPLRCAGFEQSGVLHWWSTTSPGSNGRTKCSNAHRWTDTRRPATWNRAYPLLLISDPVQIQHPVTGSRRVNAACRSAAVPRVIMHGTLPLGEAP